MRKMNVKGSKWLFFTLIASGILLLSFSPVRAEEEKAAPPADSGPCAEAKPSVSLYVDFLNQYVFRGVAASANSAVIQPSATVTYFGFSFNAWTNFDTREELFNRNARWNETDLTLSYSREIFKNLTATGGYVRYFLKHSDDQNEVFAGLSYAFPWLTVGVTGYREFHDFPGWWLQIDLSRNFKLPWYDMNVDVGASFGYLDSNPQAFTDWHSCTLSAALNVPIGKYITVSPKIGYAFPLTGAGEDNIRANSWDHDPMHLFGGIRIAASF